MKTHHTINKVLTVALLVLALGTGQICAAETLLPDAIRENTDMQKETLFPIKQFAFTGNEHVNSAALHPVLSHYIGEKMSVKDLVAAREIIRQQYQKEGYMVYVGIPHEIGLDGVATFKIIELKLGKVTITGNKYFSEKIIRKALPEIQEGKTPNIKKLSKQLYLANENPARQMMLNFRPYKKSAEEIAAENAADLAAGKTEPIYGEGIEVVVQVNDKQPIISGMTIDNTGTKESGQNRLSLFHFDSALNDHGDFMGISFTTSPDNSSKVFQTGLYYQIPIVEKGDKLILTASYSNVDNGRIADAFNISGQGGNFGMHYSHPIKQTLLSKEAVEYGYDFHRYINNVDYSGTQLGVNVDSQPLTIGYSLQRNTQGENLFFGLTYGHNIPGGSRNNAEVYEQSRVGANPNFDFWRMNGNYQKTYKNGWTLNLVAEGQYSGDALISGEQFALGGANSVRGFGEREIAGDMGVRLTTELYSPYITKNQRLVLFLDQGWYNRNNVQIGETKEGYMSGAGIGWRFYEKEQWSAKVDLACALKSDGITASGNKKIHFSVTKFF